ncbi:cation:proton antiporter [Pedobacter endophyticus]|uniref:Sodium:proton antiporter n=1 Tax=Pedobacter endophyticus TaxID=2789740 RepID=A0A7S9KZH6_9SPHI|nr:sodium:proton antiporter [Pedobacter endophyticus]QPH39702.1 sodium:proton antiporter [Pedobacter endophyticus]
MNAYFALTILICLSAAFAYVNQRFLKLPFVIGLFLLSTVLSLVVISSRLWIDIPIEDIKDYIEHANIDKIVLNVLLGFLLFAGAMHTNWTNLKQQIRPIATFALGGVLLSTVIIAFLFSGLTSLFDLNIDFIYCLVFGALISPTDPIAVLGILTKANVPKKTEYTIVGESLFNDGVGVVVFIVLIETLNTGTFSLSHFGFLFLQEAVGGIIMGLIFGYILYLLLKSIDHYETEILLTLAFVMGGYGLFNFIHISGALAMVVMGLMVGNFRQKLSMSDTTQEYIHKFWELVDVVLNAILFIMIAFVLVVIDFQTKYIFIGVISVFIVLLSRIVIVYLPHLAIPRLLKLTNKEAKIISWGGLRGGLSLALALSLPNGETKNIILVATYFCVLFSIIIQGLTIEKLAKQP